MPGFQDNRSVHLDLLGRAGSGNGLLVVVAGHTNQDHTTVYSLAAADCRVGSLRRKPGLVD